RLRAHDVLAGRRRGLAERSVQVVRDAEIDEVDVVAAQQLLGVLAHLGDAVLPGVGLRLRAAARGDGDEACRRTERRVAARPGPGDEAGAEDADAYLGDRGRHGRDDTRPA